MRGDLDCIRFRSELSPENEKSVKEYLSRTTLFWNYIVQAVAKEARSFIKETNSLDADECFLDKVLYHFNLLTKGNIEAITPKWRRYVSTIRELPLPVLQHRLKDLVEAYETAKQHVGKEIKNPTRLPKNKSGASSQSVRFGADGYRVSGDWVIVNQPFEVRIYLEELSTKLNPSKRYTFSITKRQSVQDIEKGPAPEGAKYVFTFKEVE